MLSPSTMIGFLRFRKLKEKQRERISKMTSLSFYLILFLSWNLFTTCSSSLLHSSQVGALLQIRKHLEYPNQLDTWSTQKTDICFLNPSLQMNVTCSHNVVSELRIMGDKPSKVDSFYGYPIPNQTLSDKFSIDSFVTTLTRLSSLRVLSLVSLGIWGPVPDKIHRLSSLEYLDLSSNFLYGTVPPGIKPMLSLRTMILDGNFFNDTIPDWISSLSNLTVLSLTNNQLRGPFPPSLGRITTLTSLALSNNEISGEVPDLSGLISLRVLDLTGNQLNSELPSLPSGLVMAFLSNSSFTGEISNAFEQMNQLAHLDLSLNTLDGKLPTALFSLPNMSYLNLASNSLTGSLPYHMVCGKKLGFVDISNNRLNGGLPSCLSKKYSKFFGNCLTVDVQHQHPESYCKGVHTPSKKNSAAKRVMLVLFVIGGIVISMAILAFGFLLVCRRYCPRGCSEQRLLHKQVQENSTTVVTPKLLANARLITQAVQSARMQNIPACRQYSMEELNEATNNFDTSSFIGEGSWGEMYKGKLQNGTKVAIRCLSLSSKVTIRNLNLRLDLLTKLQHPHLVCLLGYCIHSSEGNNKEINTNKVYLVYEYVPNGNLRSILSDSESVKALKWPERLANLIDVAKAVHFLQTGVIPGFFNNRLKMHNILLDENGNAKLSDYGLSVIVDSHQYNAYQVCGGNTDSWKMKMLEDDIYSFGLILLESLLGPSVTTMKHTVLLKEMAALGSKEGQKRVVEPLVLATSSEESLSTVIAIINRCLSSDSISRPSFEDVLWNLQYAAQLQSVTDDPSQS